MAFPNLKSLSLLSPSSFMATAWKVKYSLGQMTSTGAEFLHSMEVVTISKKQENF